jgi:hypothetical protein
MIASGNGDSKTGRAQERLGGIMAKKGLLVFVALVFAAWILCFAAFVLTLLMIIPGA